MEHTCVFFLLVPAVGAPSFRLGPPFMTAPEVATAIPWYLFAQNKKVYHSRSNSQFKKLTGGLIFSYAYWWNVNPFVLPLLGHWDESVSGPHVRARGRVLRHCNHSNNEIGGARVEKTIRMLKVTIRWKKIKKSLM